MPERGIELGTFLLQANDAVTARPSIYNRYTIYIQSIVYTIDTQSTLLHEINATIILTRRKLTRSEITRMRQQSTLN